MPRTSAAKANKADPNLVYLRSAITAHVETLGMSFLGEFFYISQSRFLTD
jgi:hypothetical protein